MKNPWVTFIKNRKLNNKNFILFIGGPTGSGKSYASLGIAEQIDPKFTVERCVFKGLELMSLINSGKLRSGSVIVFEEAGIDISNRNWQSLQNKVLNYLFQTFRHKRFVLIMNSPYMDFIDKATRKLFHAEFLTMEIDKNKRQVILKPQLIQYNGRKDKFYYKYLRFDAGDGGLMAIKEWGIDKPSPELLTAYEEKKTAFTGALNKEIMEGLEAKEEKERNKAKPEWKCQECGYIWKPRNKTPAYCPKCRKVDVCVPREPVKT